MRTREAVFVFVKEGDVRCLWTDEVLDMQDYLRAEGWEHTATLDPAKFIESAARGDIDPEKIESLRNQLIGSRVERHTLLTNFKK